MQRLRPIESRRVSNHRILSSCVCCCSYINIQLIALQPTTPFHIFDYRFLALPISFVSTPYGVSQKQETKISCVLIPWHTVYPENKRPKLSYSLQLPFHLDYRFLALPISCIMPYGVSHKKNKIKFLLTEYTCKRILLRL